MHPLARLIASNTFRQASRFVLLTVIFPIFSFTSFAQTQRLERRFPVKDKPTITILNAKSVTVSLADKNEVTMRAEITGAATGNEGMKIQAQDNKLQITCPPPS